MQSDQKIEEYYAPNISQTHQKLFENFCESFDGKFCKIGWTFNHWDKVLNCKKEQGKMIFTKCRIKFYTSQPYSYGDRALIKKELHQWREEKEVRYITLDCKYSFYNPGESTLVIYYLPEDEEWILERTEKYKELCEEWEDFTHE